MEGDYRGNFQKSLYFPRRYGWGGLQNYYLFLSRVEESSSNSRNST